MSASTQQREQPQQRPMRWYEVPAGTPSRACRSKECGARLYFVRTSYNTTVPVDCDVEGGKHPSAATDAAQTDAFGVPGEKPRVGRGVSHFQTCADPELFTKRGDRGPTGAAPRGCV